MNFYILLFFTMLAVVTSQNCTFPKWLEILALDSRWRTDVKIDKDLPSINAYKKTNTFVEVRRGILTIMKYEKKSMLDQYEYICFKDLERGRFVLKRKSREIYRCVEFHQRSKFVAQWRLGEEESTNTNCPGDFAPVSEWPLVYWPVMAAGDINKVHLPWSLLEDYPSCPALGGYEIRVNTSHGDERFRKCPNDYPSPRIEFECGAGEGIVFTESTNRVSHCNSIKGKITGIGARLYCLATWEEGVYTYSVLVPTDFEIESFHCLRLKTDDPTSEPAILFLDNVCRYANPDPSRETYMTLELRRNRKISGFCDDYSDQCQDSSMSCDIMEQRNACYKTCDACPDINKTVSFDQRIQGTWILQKGNVQQQIQINDTEIAFPGLGTFKSYSSNLSEECIPTQPVFERGLASEYVLAQTRSNCLPRVMQFRMTKVSPSVALIAMPGTAPLRNNHRAQVPSKWCWNNKEEYYLKNRPFHPYWPLVTYSLGYESQWYTVVKEDKHTSVNCSSSYFDQADGQVDLNIPSCKQCTCKGTLQSVSESQWSFNYSACSNDHTSIEITFNCLAKYKLSVDYMAVVMSSKVKVTEWGSDLEYFTLLYPKERYKGDYYILLNAAAESDFQFAFAANQMVSNGLSRLPIARLRVQRWYKTEDINSGGDSKNGRDSKDEADKTGEGSEYGGDSETGNKPEMTTEGDANNGGDSMIIYTSMYHFITFIVLVPSSLLLK